MGETKTGLSGFRRGAVKLQAVVLAGNLLGGTAFAYGSETNNHADKKPACVKHCGHVAVKEFLAARPLVKLPPLPLPEHSHKPKPKPKPTETAKPSPKPKHHHQKPHAASPHAESSAKFFARLRGKKGNDIGWPQCDYTSLPPEAGVAVVELNEIDRGDKRNPCLAGEIKWAKQKAPRATMFYAFAENPGPKAPDWPADCKRQDTPACAKEYGEIRARDDLAYLRQSAKIANFALTAGQMIWIDVEYNRQRTNYERGPGAAENNVAMLEGMNHEYRAAGFATGWYSFAYHWDLITQGLVGEKKSLHGMPEWQPTHGEPYDAACNFRPLEDGDEIVMTQDQEKVHHEIFDADYVCR